MHSGNAGWLDDARAGRLATLTFGAAVALALLPFVVMAWFAYPAADDFCFAWWRSEFGYGGVNAYYYNTWTGRFASTAILTFLPLDVPLYRIYALATMLGMALAIFIFVYVCIGRVLRVRDTAGIAAVITVVYFNMMPLIAEGVYWLPGSVTYQWASILLLAVASLAIIATRATRTITAIGTGLAACVLAVPAAAMNESNMTMLVGVLLSSAVVCVRACGNEAARRRAYIVWGAVIICALAGAAAVILAPGNAVRVGYSHQSGRPVWTVVLSAINVVAYGARWVATASLLVGTLLCVPAGLRACHAMRAKGIRPPGVALTIVATVCILGLGFLPPSWGLGMRPPDRTLNAICFLFVLGWFTAVLGALYRISEQPDHGLAAPSPRVRLATAVLFGITLLSSNVLTAYGDIGRNAGRFRSENIAREREVLQARTAGLKDVTLTAFTGYPGTIYLAWADVQPEADHWINRCYADNAGFRNVTTRPGVTAVPAAAPANVPAPPGR